MDDRIVLPEPLDYATANDWMDAMSEYAASIGVTSHPQGLFWFLDPQLPERTRRFWLAVATMGKSAVVIPGATVREQLAAVYRDRWTLRSMAEGKP